MHVDVMRMHKRTTKAWDPQQLASRRVWSKESRMFKTHSCEASGYSVKTTTDKETDARISIMVKTKKAGGSVHSRKPRRLESMALA